MSFVPKNRLTAYRVSGNQIIMSVNGTTTQGVASVTVNTRGTYASAPSVSIPGAVATATVGVKSTDFTGIPDPGASIVPEIYSENGQGAQLQKVYGAPNVDLSGRYFLLGSQSVSVSGGNGASYDLLFTPYEINIPNFSTAGTYPALISGVSQAEPVLASSPSVSGNPVYALSAISFTAKEFNVQAGLNSCFGAPVDIYLQNTSQLTSPEVALSYRPTMWSPITTVEAFSTIYYYWDPADPLPTFSILASTSGSGASLSGRYAIFGGPYLAAPNGLGIDSDFFELTNPGTDYTNGTTFTITGGGLPAGMSVSGWLDHDGANGLVFGGIDQQEQGHIDEGPDMHKFIGYFSSAPTVTIDHAAGGSTNEDAVLVIKKMRLVRVVNSSGSGYTGADISALGATGTISATNLRDQNGGSTSGSQIYLRTALAQSVSIINAGENYNFDPAPAFGGGPFVIVTNGAIASSTPPPISVDVRLKRIDGISGAPTTAQTITFTPPPSGTPPTLGIRCAVDSVTCTNRGTGYSSPAVTATGFFTNQSLTTALPSSVSVTPFVQALSVTNRGSGYIAGDAVYLGSQFSVTEVEVASVLVSDPGSGLAVAPAVSFSGGGQTVAATATAVLGTPTAALVTLPISSSDINVATGDARAIALGLCEAFYQIFADGASNRVSANTSSSFNAGNLDRTVTFTFVFELETSNPYTLKPEP